MQTYTILRCLRRGHIVWACFLMPVDDAEGKNHELSVLESLLGMNVGAGRANNQVFLCALEDGVVTPAEMDQTDLILEEMEIENSIFA